MNIKHLLVAVALCGATVGCTDEEVGKESPLQGQPAKYNWSSPEAEKVWNTLQSNRLGEREQHRRTGHLRLCRRNDDNRPR